MHAYVSTHSIDCASNFGGPIVTVTPRLKLQQRGAWVAQSVKYLTSAQVMIPRFVSLSPIWDSGVTAQSLESASDSVSRCFSAPPLLMLCLSVSLKNK